MEHVCRIATADEWSELERTGATRGAELDRRDGFVHLSYAHQVEATLRAHFAGRDDVLVLTVRVDRLPEEALRAETSRGGETFPHLYAPLPLAAVVGRRSA